MSAAAQHRRAVAAAIKAELARWVGVCVQFDHCWIVVNAGGVTRKVRMSAASRDLRAVKNVVRDVKHALTEIGAHRI